MLPNKIFLCKIYVCVWTRKYWSLITIIGREDFGGLDNDALDFSQLEDFITDDTDGNGR